MAYDKQHKKDYKQFNIKLHYDEDRDVIEFLDYSPNKRKAICAVIRAWLDPVISDRVILNREDLK